MTWVSILIRTVGAAFPGASSLVQLQSELDARALEARVRAIEDPISGLHPDIRELSRQLYDAIRASNESNVEFDRAFYDRYARPLALLEAEGHIRGSHSFGVQYQAGFWIANPGYLLYMCALYEDAQHMTELVSRVDGAPRGTALRGAEIAVELSLPVPVVRAVFQVYEARGLGTLSKTVGETNYRARA